MVETTDELERTLKDSGCGIIEVLSRHFSEGDVRCVVTFPRYIKCSLCRLIRRPEHLIGRH
jgi:hypothetical protein